MSKLTGAAKQAFLDRMAAGREKGRNPARHPSSGRGFIVTGEGRLLKYLGFPRGVAGFSKARVPGDLLAWRGGAGNAILVTRGEANRLVARYGGVWKPTGTRNPAKLRRAGRRFRVGKGRKVFSRATTRARAQRQLNLLRAVKHGWKPTRRPAKDIRVKIKRRLARATHRDVYAFARRRGRNWVAATKPSGGRVLAGPMKESALRAWARRQRFHTIAS